MKEIVHIGVNWHGHYPYQTKSLSELENNRKLVEEVMRDMGYAHIYNHAVNSYDFKVEKTDNALKILLERLDQHPNLISPFISVDKEFTPQDLEAAELLLWRVTNQAIKDDYYDPYTGKNHQITPYREQCSTCRAPLNRKRPLIVDKRLFGKKHISSTYQFEVILNEKVVRLLQVDDTSGFELLPVQHYAARYKDEPNLYQLKVTNILPEMASPPTEFERFQSSVGLVL